MSKFLNEFKQFAMRGNVLDMAGGVDLGVGVGCRCHHWWCLW